MITSVAYSKMIQNYIKKLGISTEAAKQVTIDKGKTTPMKKT